MPVRITETIEKISGELAKHEEVELIYYIINDDKTTGKAEINYTVACNLESVITNQKLLKQFLAIEEVIKELYSKANIETNFNLISSKEFEETTSEYISTLNNANIIYTNDDLSSLIERKCKRK